MPLNIVYKGNETTVEDDATVLIGSDAASAIRIARPGISRKHAVVSFDGETWKVEDAGSRNGIFADGERVRTTVINGPTTLYLGHPTEGEAISFVVLPDGKAPSSESTIQDEIDSFVATPKATPSTRSAPAAAVAFDQTQVQPVTTTAALDAELAALTAALRDQINTLKGLTWSVWAMIAVTAALSVMTLFVGVLGN